eukprot:1894254-Amphidinium_carterae.1
MPSSGSAPDKPFSKILNVLAAFSPCKPASGSVPVKLFSSVEKQAIAVMVRMLSGSTPVKAFLSISKKVTSLIAPIPLSGSV